MPQQRFGTERDQEFLPHRRWPLGHPNHRPLPDAVWVPLAVLGVDSRDWGGLSKFLGEPQQRWQENGVSFFFVKFGGSIGGKKVRVADCQVVEPDASPRGRGHVAGPSSPGYSEPEERDGEFPVFPTQRLDESTQSGGQSVDEGAGGDDESTIELVRVHPPAAQETTTPRGAPTNGSGAWSDDNTDDEWQADWRDFAGDASSLDLSDSGSGSDGDRMDLRHEIGDYGDTHGLDEMDLRARYHDRFWQCPETTLLGDRESFTGPRPGPKQRVTHNRKPALDFFKLFFNDVVVEQIVEQTNLYAEQQGTGRS